MIYIKLFETFNKKENLLIVDVQKSFSKYFTKAYLEKLKEYASQFENVYQIWDNHSQGPNVDKDYLYEEDPHIPNIDDIYDFPKEKDRIEKRYNYQVNADFYKNILDKETYNTLKQKEENKSLKRGDIFKTTEGTILVYIGNNHVYFHCPIKLYQLFESIKGKEIILVGGSFGECLLDIETTAKSMGVKTIQNKDYIYSASYCPI
jgi:hypothetical protein